jgi:hypothetical protein
VSMLVERDQRETVIVRLRVERKRRYGGTRWRGLRIGQEGKGRKVIQVHHVKVVVAFRIGKERSGSGYRWSGSGNGSR